MKTSDTSWITILLIKITIVSSVWTSSLQQSNKSSTEKFNELEKKIMKKLNNTEETPPISTTIISLSNHTFHVNTDTVWLTDLILKINFIANNINLYPDLRLMNMKIAGDIEMVQVSGNYEFFSDELIDFDGPIPTVDNGKFILAVKNLRVKGVSGVSFKHNSVLVHSLDLVHQHNKRDMNMTFKHRNGSVQWTNNMITKSVVDHLEYEMKRVVDSFVKNNINTILNSVKISEVFPNYDSSRSFHDIVYKNITKINELVDNIIGSVRQLITTWGITRIAAPNISETFFRKIAFFTFTGEFKASEGWFEALDTIRRTNDFFLSTDEHDLLLEGEVGLSVARISYDRYKVKFMDIGPSGSLTADVSKNSVHFKLRASFTGKKRFLSFVSLELKELEISNIYITGLGPFNWLTSKIATWISNSLKYTILSVINDMLPAAAHQAARNFDCENCFSEYP